MYSREEVWGWCAKARKRVNVGDIELLNGHHKRMSFK